jgi:bifunctional non-homologous end joining protein LigD
VAPWSTRAKPAATVSVPVTFDMLQSGLGPADFRVGDKAIDDVLEKPDPWADFFKAAKALNR